AVEPEFSSCSRSEAVIDPAFTGDYLLAIDRRTAVDTVYLAPAYVGLPYAWPVWRAGATTSIGIVGRIAPATGPRTVECGKPLWLSPAPSIEGRPGVAPKPLAKLSRRGIAAVRCSIPCRIELHASRNAQHVGVTRILSVRGTATVRLPIRALRDLGRGRAEFVVDVDGIEL